LLRNSIFITALLRDLSIPLVVSQRRDAFSERRAQLRKGVHDMEFGFLARGKHDCTLNSRIAQGREICRCKDSVDWFHVGCSLFQSPCPSVGFGHFGPVDMVLSFGRS